MKRRCGKCGIAFVASLAIAAVVGGCTTLQAPVIPPLGGVYSEIQAPLDIDLHETTLGSKQGRSESFAILSLIAMGDASVAGAARKGGLSTIHHVDYEYFNVLGIYQKFTTVVYGD